VARPLSRLLDRSVVFDFDRTGFRRHARSFGSGPERSLHGTRVLITGGTAGIGRAAAQAIVGRGASVEVWGRNAERGHETEAAIGARFVQVDLGELAAVAETARATIAASDAPLSGVVLNAGAMPLERRETSDGHELVWASQVLGHLALLRVLYAYGVLDGQSRVVWVSSGGMYTQGLDLSDLERRRGYRRHVVYANAKRAQVELSGRLARRWPEVPMAAMHPGWVDTAAVRHSMPVFRALTRPILRTPEQGADTIVWLLTAAESWASGRFWFDRRAVSTHTTARTETPDAVAETLVAGAFEATEEAVRAACAGRQF
jgi:NAD(P)-dependent dehydrogenase (short-subunit alcohol dehydrogenase family)